MRQYHCCRIEVQGAFDHLTGMYLGTANRTGKQGFMGNKLVLLVQIQHHKLFALQSRHFQFQPVTGSLSGGECHACFVQVSDQVATNTFYQNVNFGFQSTLS